MHMKGELRKASAHFEKALEINPRYTEASLNLAITYNDLGEFKKAQEVLHDGGPDRPPLTPTPLILTSRGNLPTSIINWAILTLSST